MRVKDFVEVIGAEFYTGIPDSLLKPLCDYLMHTYGIDPEHHLIAANEGNCAALGAGYYLATGKVPVIYMQNSGEGNIINPLASLLSDKVYAIPMVFVIGWRGEPGVHDEPQHVYQGMVTLKLLEDMGVKAFIVGKETTVDELKDIMTEYRALLKKGRDVAFVVRKGALSYEKKVVYKNDNTMLREEIIRHIVEVSERDPIISTTGKASRELFELRATNGQSHKYDFLTVGSMGHTSSIALGVAIHRPRQKIWCIDGDGAVLMHMGAMAVLGSVKPQNLVHVVINNGAHETVGGMPTVAQKISLPTIAKACGYDTVDHVDDFDSLDKVLKRAKETSGLHFVEVASAIGAREDLGRPTTTAMENKKNFKEYIEMKRIYFDYNIYTKLADKKIMMPENSKKYMINYISVAHAEEYYNAKENDDGNNVNQLKNIKFMLSETANDIGILNPKIGDIIYSKKEKFEDCLARIKKYDTRDIIRRDAKNIWEDNVRIYKKILELDRESQNNSNCSIKEIWKRPEVIDRIKIYKAEEERRNNHLYKDFREIYSEEEARYLAVKENLSIFDIKKDMYKNYYPNFVEMEFTIEFLNNVLTACGYCKDKDERKTNSGIYDVEHAIYATYCDFFVTDDKRLAKRMNAIYYFLGLKTKCISFDEMWQNLEKIDW